MFYIGFNKLSEFITALDPSRHVYLAPLNLVKDNGQIGTSTVSMIASQPMCDHLLYCMINISRWSELHGHPFGQTDADRADRAPHLKYRMWTFIIDRLRDSYPNLVLYEGVPSFPKDLMLIPGTIEGIAYDEVQHEFIEEAI